MRDELPPRAVSRPGDIRTEGAGNRMRAATASSAAARARAAPLGVPATPALRPGRATASGVAAALGMALVWSLLAGLLDVSWGLVFLAAVGGWIVAVAVVAGAFGDAEHRPDPRIRALAVVLALAVWLLGTFGSYLVGLAILPGSTASLGERIANAPFVESLVSQLALLDIAEIALLASVAWRSAR